MKPTMNTGGFQLIEIELIAATLKTTAHPFTEHNHDLHTNSSAVGHEV